MTRTFTLDGTERQLALDAVRRRLRLLGSIYERPARRGRAEEALLALEDALASPPDEQERRPFRKALEALDSAGHEDAAAARALLQELLDRRALPPMALVVEDEEQALQLQRALYWARQACVEVRWTQSPRLPRAERRDRLHQQLTPLFERLTASPAGG